MTSQARTNASEGERMAHELIACAQYVEDASNAIEGSDRGRELARVARRAASTLSTAEARISELEDALQEAEAGLEFAGADKDIPEGSFVPTPTLALRAVRKALGGRHG